MDKIMIGGKSIAMTETLTHIPHEEQQASGSV